MAPETWAQVTAILAAVVPGFVYQGSRRRVAGPDPEQADLGERVLHAIAATAVFAGGYALIIGPTVRDYVRAPDRALDDVQFLGMYFVLFAVLIPWAAARVVFFVGSSSTWGRAAGRLTQKLGMLAILGSHTQRVGLRFQQGHRRLGSSPVLRRTLARRLVRRELLRKLVPEPPGALRRGGLRRRRERHLHRGPARTRWAVHPLFRRDRCGLHS